MLNQHRRWFAWFYLFIPIVSWGFNIVKWFADFYWFILIVSSSFNIVDDFRDSIGGLFIFCHDVLTSCMFASFSFGLFLFWKPFLFLLLYFLSMLCFIYPLNLKEFSVVVVLLFSILLMFFYAFFHFDNIDLFLFLIVLSFVDTFIIFYIVIFISTY